MIVLDTITKKLEVVLAGAVTTTQLPITASYVDVGTDVFLPGASDTVSNSTTAVSAVLAPATSIIRQVKLLTIYNADTATATVTVRLNNNSTTRIMVKIDLDPQFSLIYTDGEGFRVIDALGSIL